MAITPNSTYPFVDTRANPAFPNWMNSPLWESMAENNRRDYYNYLIGGRGQLGVDPKSQFAQDLYGNFESGYQAERFANPNVNWVGYMRNRLGEIDKQWAAQSPEQRGVNYGAFRGRTNWLQRG